MKIVYQSAEMIDRRRYDETIARSYNGIVYAYSWYLDIMADNWGAMVGDDYAYVFPFAWRKKWGIRYVYVPFFVQQLGLFSARQIRPDLVEEFAQAVPRQFKWVVLQLNSYNKGEAVGFDLLKRTTFELDLIPMYELLYKGFSTNVKRNIKKATKNNYRVLNTVRPEAIVDLFLSDKLGKFPDAAKADYGRLKRLMYAVIQRGVGQIWGVYDKHNSLCAAAFFIEANNKVIFLFSATNEQGRREGAMFLLLNEFIKKNAARNLTLDFEGSDIPSLARFYKSFGAQKVAYSRWTKNRLPFPLRLLKSKY